MVLAGLGASCKTNDGESKSESEELSGKNVDDGDEEYFDNDEEGDENSAADNAFDDNSDNSIDDNSEDSGGELSLKHPTEATAHSTSALLLTENQPTNQQLQNCEVTVKSVAQKAYSVSGMHAAERQLHDIVAEDEDVYHWCFYQLVNQMDIKLKSPVLLIHEKSSMFLKSMKELWILAKALGADREKNLYCYYLRHRYININQFYFGRKLKIVDETQCKIPL